MQRIHYLEQIQFKFKINPIVALIGPRQCGKTTLARMFAEKQLQLSPENYFDLESLSDLARLANPELTLSKLTGLVVIDEIQRFPNLFPTLRVLVDRPQTEVKFLILGSASRELIQDSSETLTGRISYLEMTPFSYIETMELENLWIRGGFPKAYLADTPELSFMWRKDYIKTFLEQDIPNLGFRIPAQNLQRFWMMIAHIHGNIFNASELGRALDLSKNTIRYYNDILIQTLMLRELKPWYENISKRQVKSPKIYFRDSGLYHCLLNIKNNSELFSHPKLGSSWEGLAVEEIIRHVGVAQEECYFWATHAHAELDLLIIKNNKRHGFEIKYSSLPKVTRSMNIAMEDLKLDSLTVIYPGRHHFPLTQTIMAIGLEKFLMSKFE